MGCDGGTIPKRDELVKTKKRPEKVIIIKNEKFLSKNQFPNDFFFNIKER